MGAFGGLILTNKGRNLQAKAQTGVQLNFTKIKIGDGSLSGQSIVDLTNLINTKKELTILGIERLTGGKAKLRSYFTNADIVTGFYWRELGVFAQDPDEGEILYCYGNAGTNAEYIPAGGGPDVVERYINVITLVGNATNVSATLGSEIYVTQADFDNHTGNIVIHVTQTEKDTWNAKETPAGAQAKADAAGSAAVTAANSYTDQQVGSVSNALAAHQADYVKQVGYATATGSANTYAVTLNPAPSALVDGLCVAVKINVDNTGASTLNVNGLGAKSIKKPNGNDVSVGNLKAGSIYTLRYNGTNFILQGEGGSGNAQPSDVLSGKTFTNDIGEQIGTMTNNGIKTITPSNIDQALSGYYASGSKVAAVTFDASKVLTGTTIAGTAGTMPNRGAVVITPSTANQAIAAGYHNGSGYVVGDPNLVPANIVSGKSIFGVVGSLIPGKKFASGTVTSSGSTTTFQKIDGSTTSQFSVAVSGLTFQPSIIIVYNPNGYYPTIYNSAGLTKDTYLGVVETYNIFYTSQNIVVNSTGFTLPAFNPNIQYNWIAIE
ncbi:hypothetical protein D2962_06205 [Biomaibacter acetigenes]|uniref:Tail fiber protein n=1 Tax=Biomaibacter acetigenes TaxID=2316383 RepID=A0A3G2R416_9FIRM|nr:hypothetical protein [Biomaibacter acetigenes]AYO30264.1 hypothetical protein D2962_06205 [Biomaibacter acetigenes]